MAKNPKPWLDYGRGDGMDKVEPIPTRTPKKISDAVWCFLLFYGIGGHRIYVGEYWYAFRWFMISLGVQFSTLPLHFMRENALSIYGIIYAAAIILFSIFIIVWEFRSIRPSIDRVNTEIETENREKKNV